jgi:pimeloyl-ACP methyl ester carboxylesterase
VAISVGWGTNDPKQPLPLQQVRNYWYHWYMGLDLGARLVREDGKKLARFAWETWGPGGWFTDADFETTAKSFENPDWAEVVLHSYRHRWRLAEGDPAYASLETKMSPPPIIAVPTLVLHGGADACNDPVSSANRERLFSGPYQRIVLDGVGHFPGREAPDAVGRAIATWLSERWP